MLRFRLDNEVELEKEITRHNPDRILSFTGRTHSSEMNNVDYLEGPGKLVENIRDNMYGPLVLALICKKLSIHLTYLGTGCLFNDDGKQTYNFVEEGQPNFFGSAYSTVKGFTDRVMHQFEDIVLNARIRMCLTETVHPRNFITKLTKYEYICSLPNSMSVLPELLPILVDLSKRKVTGTVNLTNPGYITHNEILEMYKEIVEPDFTWKNFSMEEQDKVLASKRSNNVLNTSKLESMYPDVLPIKPAVKKCLIKMKENKDGKVAK
ncbi:MAG: hypothetical protein EOP45_20190 [Sphingobacteriaceae bacterium]|nr:MAG: hypothetical protein EOP45_20190 [Sphingobacteriaceae bacterium]